MVLKGNTQIFIPFQFTEESLLAMPLVAAYDAYIVGAIGQGIFLKGSENSILLKMLQKGFLRLRKTA
jgi:hypothetical protein